MNTSTCTICDHPNENHSFCITEGSSNIFTHSVRCIWIDKFNNSSCDCNGGLGTAIFIKRVVKVKKE